jgi:two-component system, NtrC family, C4-dicarboxylate transport sensor histidine kinase DctB
LENKNIYIIKNLVLLLSICVVIILAGSNWILIKEKELLSQKYTNITSNLQDKINSLIETKKNATLSIALTLAENDKAKDVLLHENNLDYDLSELSEKLKNYTDFKNVWFHIIDSSGVSIYRSWTDNKNDKIKSYRLDLQEVLLKPEVKNSISVGIYDITFKSMVPIYKDKKFIGILECITHFNSITRELRNNYMLEPIILVDKIFTNQLRDNSFSKIFLKDHYVANLSVSKELLKYLDSQDLEEFLRIKDYLIKDDKLVMNIPIIEDGVNLANMLIFQNMDKINISEIIEFKTHAFSYLLFFVLFLCLIISIWSYYIYTKRLKELNNILQDSVNDAVLRNDEKNKIIFQQNKMAAIGEMIGNIAHQWRQPLSIITTAASSIKLKKELNILEDDEHNQSLNYIIDASNYLSNTIDDFQYYFSPNKSKNIFYTEDLINKLLNLISAEFKENNIYVIKKIENIEILNYENEILQVLINILNNAKDELKKDLNMPIGYIFIDLYKENETLIIKIKDNAGGIKEEIIDRIFEPYFTTKHQSQGTGIGLYMSEEIIVKHIKGSIKVSNEKFTYLNKEFIGAMFEITIPL